MRTRYIILLAFFLLLSCRGNPDYSEPPASRNSLRFVVINVWSGLDYTGNLWMGEYETREIREKRYRALISQLKQLDADIVGVHEANKLPDYAEKLARDLGYDVFYHVGLGGVRLGKVGLPWNLREGDAVLTKKDLYAEFAGREQLSGGHVGNFFTFHFGDATQIIGVKMTNHGKPLYVFATHWHASLFETAELRERAQELIEQGEATAEEYREVEREIREGEAWRLEECEKSLAFIRKTAGTRPFVFLGDFNASSNSEEIKRLLRFGMVDAFAAANPESSGFTWDPEANLNVQQHYLNVQQKDSEMTDLRQDLQRLHEAMPKRIDYIFVQASDEISVKSSRVVFDEVIDGVHASDHFGVLAEIEFKL